jgi:SAM-dependent methyltransferase
MAHDLTFTGERFVPGIEGEIVYEHVHRYAFARRYAAGRRVLDAACGEGYGSAILAGAAREVVGVDIDPATVAHARASYASVRNLSFVEGSAAKLPLPDASVDLVVSFETIEHLEAGDQPRMLAEFARVLADGGALVLSAPNRPEYSESRGYVNPFHRHEHDRAELDRLLDAHFPARAWHAQRVWLGSTVWREGGGADDVEAFVGDASAVAKAPVPPAMYFVVVAARRAAALPPPAAALSLFSDAGETELKRAASAAAEAMRLDGLLKDRERIVAERDAQLARANAHVAHLEGLLAARESLIAEREHLVAERDDELRRVNARADRLEQLASARERLVAERDDLLARTNDHVKHLEELAAFRERLVVERDTELAARDAELAARDAELAARGARIEADGRALALARESDAAAQQRIADTERLHAETRGRLAEARRRIAEVEAECGRLDRALDTQERIIAYRQSFRWWLVLPWMRVKLMLSRLSGG